MKIIVGPIVTGSNKLAHLLYANELGKTSKKWIPTDLSAKRVESFSDLSGIVHSHQTNLLPTAPADAEIFFCIAENYLDYVSNLWLHDNAEKLPTQPIQIDKQYAMYAMLKLKNHLQYYINFLREKPANCQLHILCYEDWNNNFSKIPVADFNVPEYFKQYIPVEPKYNKEDYIDMDHLDQFVRKWNWGTNGSLIFNYKKYLINSSI